MIIPHEKLSEDALLGLVGAFITREGTDYGERETPFSEKVAQVYAQLTDGVAVILYDPRDESFTIVRADELPEESNEQLSGGAGFQSDDRDDG
jgi:uncharacterized protein YheU (UPF0270 family)